MAAFVWNDGEQPYSDYNKRMIYLQGDIAAGLRPTLKDGCPVELVQVMQSSWSGNPAERQPFSSIVSFLEKVLAYYRQ